MIALSSVCIQTSMSGVKAHPGAIPLPQVSTVSGVWYMMSGVWYLMSGVLPSQVQLQLQVSTVGAGLPAESVDCSNLCPG